MHRLLTLTLGLIGTLAHASPGTVDLSYQSESQIQFRELDVPKDTTTLGIQSPTFFEYYQVGLKWIDENQDFSNRRLIDENGNQKRFSEIDSGHRQVIAPSISANWGRHLLSLSAQTDVAPTSLAQASQGLTYQFQAFGGATNFILGLNHFNQHQPVNYYIDPVTLQSRKRPSTIEGREVALGVEQFLNEQWKGRIDLKHLELVDYRPPRYSVVLASLLALGSRWTLRNDLGYATENRDHALKDDRGHFSAVWFDNQVTYEWRLDSFITLGWMTSQENETDPRRGTKNLLGSDVVAIEVEHKLKRFKYVVGLSLARTSDGDSAESGKGNVQWEF